MASNTSAEEAWKKKFVQYLRSGKDSISILTCGNMGSGKSSLVNGLIGRVLAKENMSPNPVTMATHTYVTTVEPKECKVEGKLISIRCLDTPGFGGIPDFNSMADDVQQDIAEKAKEADLVLYCMDMRQRLPIEGIGVVKLTKLCGQDVWENALIALTFANKIDSPYNDAEKFRRLVTEWKEAIGRLLQEQNVQPSVIQAIPIVPVGYRETPPPDRNDWLSPFWEAAFNRTRSTARPSLFYVNMDRIRVGPTHQSMPTDAPTDQQLEAHEQSITLSPEFLVGRRSYEKVKVAIVAGGGGVVTGVAIGALIGCVVGVAGGIFAPLTMPLTAGVGAVVGGVVGAASLGGLASVIESTQGNNR